MSTLKNNLFLGIDLGARAVKIVLLSKEKGGRLRLVKSEYNQYETALNFDSQQQRAVLTDILKKFLRKEKDLRNAKIGISIAGQAAFVRLVKIPLTTPKNLHKIIRYETQQQIPFPIKDVVWDFQIYSRHKKELSVLLVAIKKELVESILKVIDDSLIDVEYIDVSNLALYNCLQYFFRDLEKTLILDLGAKTTNIIVVGAEKIWTRSLPFGGEDITEAIARKLNVTREEAEQLKKEKGNVLMLYYGKERSASEQEQKVAEIITSVLTDLTNEIVKTLNFYKSQHEMDMDFRKALITGGVSKTPNIDKFFENSLAIPTQIIDYFSFLSVHPKVDMQTNEFLGTALGLALRGAGRSVLNIDLLPPERMRIKNFRKKRPFIIFSSVFLFLILLSFGSAVLNQYFLSKRYLNALKSEVSKYEKIKGPLDRLEADVLAYENKLKTIAEALNKKYTGVLVLDNIVGSVPKSIWLEELNIDLDGRYIFLQGRCQADLNEIGLFQDALQEKDIFQSVQIKTVGKDDAGKITFSLKIKLI